MAGDRQSTYRFSDFLLVTRDKQLLRNGTPVSLKPKAYQTLLMLVENRGHLIEKEEFLKQLWPDSFVEEVSLAQNISQLRRALSAGLDVTFIETVPRLGYRFIAQVEVVAEQPNPASPVNIAVLPFEMIGGIPDREYLADGLTDEVIASLGQVDPSHIQVIGRTSVMSYKKTSKSLAEIGRELGASFLLESSMKMEGDRIRVTSKLIRAADQVQNWSASYDAEPSSMLVFQRELSKAIAEQIRLRLSPERLEALNRRQTANPEAYDAYLQGRYYWNHYTPATTRRAVECFTRATTLDSRYALAWSGIADAFSSAPIHADACPTVVWQKARAAAESAASAEPELPETQTSVGMLKFWLDWDWDGAEIAFRHAIRLDPNYSLAHRMLGILLGHRRQDAEARAEMDRARSLDPLDAMHYALSAQVGFVTRNYSGAIGYARHSTIILPDFWIGHYQLAQAYEQRGEYDQALEALRKATEFGGGNSKVLSLRGYVLAKLGRVDEAASTLETIRLLCEQRYFPPYATALVHAGIGSTDAVFEHLERALECHDVHLVLLTADPKWDWLRSDPRFISLVKRAGLSE
jgi:DNA-binding winged helix-turn-helix (wHTH) protein/Tfp pilus assembly protein PilF